MSCLCVGRRINIFDKFGVNPDNVDLISLTQLTEKRSIGDFDDKGSVMLVAPGDRQFREVEDRTEIANVLSFFEVNLIPRPPQDNLRTEFLLEIQMASTSITFRVSRFCVGPDVPDTKPIERWFWPNTESTQCFFESCYRDFNIPTRYGQWVRSQLEKTISEKSAEVPKLSEEYNSARNTIDSNASISIINR